MGAYGTDLQALSGFFEVPWTRIVTGVTTADAAFIYGEAGFDLRALGRSLEAGLAFRAALDADLALREWKQAANDAVNLGELFVTTGDLREAEDYARHSVVLSDRSGNLDMPASARTLLA